MSMPNTASLDLAETFIRSHAHHPIGLPEIADAAGITPRGLQLTFRLHRDTTPLRHLRDVRLAGAHDDLEQADPDRGDTVAEIAARWGFHNPGRFSRCYADAYGTRPRVALLDAPCSSSAT